MHNYSSSFNSGLTFSCSLTVIGKENLAFATATILNLIVPVHEAKPAEFMATATLNFMEWIIRRHVNTALRALLHIHLLCKFDEVLIQCRISVDSLCF